MPRSILDDDWPPSRYGEKSPKYNWVRVFIGIFILIALCIALLASGIALLHLYPIRPSP